MFGKYDLKEVGKKWVEENLGKDYVEDFEEKYENINRGIPIGGMYETMLFVDMVNRIKAEYEAKSPYHRFMKCIREMV